MLPQRPTATPSAASASPSRARGVSVCGSCGRARRPSRRAGSASRLVRLSAEADEQRWFLPGVRAIGAASLLSDLGHEVPTALLPSFLSDTLGLGASRAAAALGLIEGIADGASGAARFAGGPLADDPARRRATAVGGYATTAVLSSLIGVATAAWQGGGFPSLAWGGRGGRGAARKRPPPPLCPPPA